MATQFEIDCALMAGRAYQINRSLINTLPVPDGWTEFFHVPNPTSPTAYGFEAVAFAKGADIVISFTGTDSLIDWLADGGLATGLGSAQLVTSTV